MGRHRSHSLICLYRQERTRFCRQLEISGYVLVLGSYDSVLPIIPQSNRLSRYAGIEETVAPNVLFPPVYRFLPVLGIVGL
jgi:hypothetical protein